MELFSAEFFSALLAIVLIDMVLAGDNAIVIALAARSLPTHLRKKAVAWGTVGAIAVRSAMTLIVVWLLKVPGLMLAGGLLLVWIAYKLLLPEEEDRHGAGKPASASFWGSTLILRFVDRYPVIIYLGAAVLAWTAAKMMLGEPLVKPYFEGRGELAWAVYGLVVAGVLGLGYRRAQVIAAFAERHKVDRVVMGTARRNSLLRLVEDSVSNRVVELSAVPVEVVPGSSVTRLEKIGIPAGVGLGLALLLSD